jgi:hypothetical protein
VCWKCMCGLAGLCLTCHRGVRQEAGVLPHQQPCGVITAAAAADTAPCTQFTGRLPAAAGRRASEELGVLVQGQRAGLICRWRRICRLAGIAAAAAAASERWVCAGSRKRRGFAEAKVLGVFANADGLRECGRQDGRPVGRMISDVQHLFGAKLAGNTSRCFSHGRVDERWTRIRSIAHSRTGFMWQIPATAAATAAAAAGKCCRCCQGMLLNPVVAYCLPSRRVQFADWTDWCSTSGAARQAACDKQTCGCGAHERLPGWQWRRHRRRCFAGGQAL